jgi:RNA polymerase sigma-70 factor (ECF subfamily)
MQPPPDHERFMRLFLEYEPEILRSVMVFVPRRSDARDIVQDTAVALWQHFPEYDSDRPFVNWAVGFARIQIRRYFRECQRQARLSEKALEALLTTSDERAAHKEHRAQVLQECLKEVPDGQRGIVEDYYFKGQTVEAISAANRRSSEATYKILQRVRRALADCVQLKLAGLLP